MFDEARLLYAVPPTEFTAARNQLAKTLKAAGRADDASFVAALKRPKITEWAVNRIAHEQPAVVDRWVAAVVGANTAQAAAIGEAAGGGDFRKAADELKAATTALVDAANEGGDDAHRYEIADLVRGLMVGDGPDLLLAGVVGSRAVSEAAGFFPGATTAGPTTSVAGRPPRVVPKPPGGPPTVPKESTGSKGSTTSAPAPRVGVRAREQLTARSERAQTDLATAKAAAADAQKLVDRTGRELERAQRDLHTRLAALDTAKKRAADLAAQLRELSAP